VGSLSVVIELAQTFIDPEIAAIAPPTFTVVVRVHPDTNVYVMVALPVPTPVTIPDDKPTVAIPVLLLVHVPAPVASDNVVVVPAHKLVFPAIAGAVFTVTAAIDLHPPPIGK
jgi:hypothetical protein